METILHKRPGRPAKSPDGAKRGSLKIRIHDKTREVLECEADANGRSLSEEAEYRLLNSLRDESIVRHILLVLGDQNADIMAKLDEMTARIRSLEGISA